MKTMLLIASMVLTGGLAVSCAAPLEATEQPAVDDSSQQPAPESGPIVEDGSENEADAPSEVDAATGKNLTRGHAWADAAIEDDAVTIPYDVAASEDHVHFTVPGSDGDVSFIGWFHDEGFNARATVCPCCGVEAIEWGGTSLVCRECSTLFDLGQPNEDAECVYPEGLLPVEVSGDVIAMSLNDLLEAHARTAAGEETLFEPEPEPVEEEKDSARSCCRR
ncbi:MAG: hypothetical protein ACOC9B_04135 [Chloroflexota bacterium]